MNDIAAHFVHTVSSLVEWELSEQFLAKILVVRGRVKALFSEKAFDRFLAMQYFIAASGSRVRELNVNILSGKASVQIYFEYHL